MRKKMFNGDVGGKLREESLDSVFEPDFSLLYEQHNRKGSKGFCYRGKIKNGVQRNRFLFGVNGFVAITFQVFQFVVVNYSQHASGKKSFFQCVVN
jgi:hypothetical protein